MISSENKNCRTCAKELHGRSDKKFCDDQCRTTYNNLQKTEGETVKLINSALRKNRKIIEQLIPVEEGKIKVSGKRLFNLGFNFSYHTHIYTTKAGANYVFCYEYGYLELESDIFMLVKRVER